MDKFRETFLSSGGEFRKCKAGTLFTVKGNPQLDKSCFFFSKNSSYPYFTRTVFNNGIFGYVDYYDDAHLIKGNSLAVGMMGMKFFYMKHDFYAGQFTKTIYPRFDGFNELVALWFVAWFNRSSKKYLSVLVREFEKTFNDTEIIVPYINGEIAVGYMEARIRELEEARIRELETYLKVAGFEDCELTEEERKALENLQTGKVQMHYFELSSLYEKVNLKNKPFDKRKDTSSQKSNEFSVPLINAKHGDNGIMFYGKEDIFPSVDMTIDIVQNGAIATGDVYAQPQKTGVLWDAYLIRAITHKDTTNTLLYFACVIKKTIKQLFSYDNKAVWDRVKKQKILLPVNDSDNIDFDFMDLYINAQMKLSIQKIKDWRSKEINATKSIVKVDTEVGKVKSHKSYEEWQTESCMPMMVAEDLFIGGSLEVRLHETKRDDLLSGKLDLMLMYAIAPVARKKTESAGKIALGIKENNLSVEAVKAYESVKYVMFHYWKNNDTKAFKLTAPTRLVAKDDIPDGYLLRQDKNACQYLLLEYEIGSPAELGEYNIMKIQRKGADRYAPFVCKLEDVKY